MRSKNCSKTEKAVNPSVADLLEASGRDQIATYGEPANTNLRADDLEIGVTFFPTYAAQSKRFETMTLGELRDKILTTTAKDKAHLPWLKLARFAEERTNKNSLRSNNNTLGITGVETDYDQGKISFEQACSILADAGIHALVYTSASHKPDYPKWRILAPASKELPPAERLKLVELPQWPVRRCLRRRQLHPLSKLLLRRRRRRTPSR
jgi:hypothetical protein